MTETSHRQPRIVMPLRRSAGAVSSREGATIEGGAALLAKVVLAGTLPLFAQIFYYLNEYPPPYLLSKAWPFLTLPLAFYGIARLKLPLRFLYLAVLAYVIGFTPLMSIIQLGNDFIGALSTTIKAWPFSYYFSLSALLALLSVPAHSVRKICLGYGAATFILMILIFLAAPTSWYGENPEDSKLLLYDLERGYRVYMPMFFGMILLFWMGRSFVLKRNPVFLLGVLLAFVPLFLIYKQRTAIGAAALVVAYGMTMSLAPRVRRLVLGAGLVALAAGAIAIAAKSGLFSTVPKAVLADGLGDSLTVRSNSLRLAFGFLGDDPMRWLFGVGATTRFSSTTINDIFGNGQFYISDLGWIGVLFEYGATGVLLLASLHIWCFVMVFRFTDRSGDPFFLALSDYILFIIASSSVYSVMFTPGELAVTTALAVYLHRRRNEPAPRRPVPKARVRLGKRPGSGAVVVHGRVG